MCLIHASHAYDKLAAGFSDHCSGYSGSINGGEFLEQLNDYQLIKISALRILFRHMHQTDEETKQRKKRAGQNNETSPLAL
jgi:hypothetical protein